MDVEGRGLVSRVALAEMLMQQINANAASIAAKSLLAVRGLKQSINRAGEHPLTAGVDLKQWVFKLIRVTAPRTMGCGT